MRVTNLTSPRTGAKVANQFVINDNGVEYFQSYDTIIAKKNDNVLTVSSDYNYSNTTSRYFRQWLKEWYWTDVEVDNLKKILKNANVGDELYFELGNIEYIIEYVDSL